MPDIRFSRRIIDSLRKGIPPQKGTERYAVGYERLLRDIEKYHFDSVADIGIIRFVNGSWGAGKTHFFRMLRDLAFKCLCLVSTVELNANSTTLNKFESVFGAIIRNIAVPSYFDFDETQDIAPFRRVLEESLIFMSRGEHCGGPTLTQEEFGRAKEKLFADKAIDIDFKKMVLCYWETFVEQASDSSLLDEKREVILQWFCGEGTLALFKKSFGVSKVVTKDNAKLLLQSLSAFIVRAGYKGLLILFDEAEKSYSVISRVALKAAHNNLLSLINNIDGLKGLFLLYATTPDFYTDPKHGIVTYGALSSRIGKPLDSLPRALDIIWNLDSLQYELKDYQAAAQKILQLYIDAYPDRDSLPTGERLAQWVEEYQKNHSKFVGVRFWRVLVSGVVFFLDSSGDEKEQTPGEVYDNILDRFREE